MQFRTSFLQFSATLFETMFLCTFGLSRVTFVRLMAPRSPKKRVTLFRNLVADFPNTESKFSNWVAEIPNSESNLHDLPISWP